MAKQGTIKKGALPDGAKILLRNKRAHFDYELSEYFETGLVLVGSEVKSLRASKGSIAGAFVRFIEGELWLAGATIKEYEWANLHNHSPTRERKLLLHRNEIRKIGIRVDQRGFSVVPTHLYIKSGKMKLQIALGKGKKEFEKRQSNKQNDAVREIDRAMKFR